MDPSRIRNRFRKRPPSRGPTRRPSFDRLEPRVPLTLGSEFPVNTTTPGEQSQPAVAENGIGRTVVVWRDVISPTQSAIKARIYGPDGSPLTGELIVNDQANTYDYDPAVAMNASGNFVVAWTVRLPDGNTKVRMARFNPDGRNAKNLNWWKAVTPVKDHTDAPSVGIDAAGDAVVAYEVNASGSPAIAQFDVYAKRYSAAGVELGMITVAAGPQEESGPSVGEQANGLFVIAYTRQAFMFAGNPWIVMNSYTPYGTQLAPPVAIAGSAEIRSPSVAWQSSANGVIAYQMKGPGGTNDIKARTFALGGSMPDLAVVLSPEIDVRSTPGQETAPAVGLASGMGLAPRGAFAVSYTVNGKAVGVTEADPTTAPGDYLRTDYGPYAQRSRSALAMAPNGRYTVVDQTIPWLSRQTVDVRALRGTV